jgi:ABC-type uncharacterized transport system ATPase subunit
VQVVQIRGLPRVASTARQPFIVLNRRPRDNRRTTQEDLMTTSADWERPLPYTRTLSEIHAVQDLDSTVPRGSILAFLGSGGARENDHPEMLLAMVKPSTG